MIKNVFSLTTVFFALAVFGGIVSRQLYVENRSLKSEISNLKSDPQVAARDEVNTLVKKLAALVVLPEGEDPVVATVTDKEKLKDQAVFANAENGDKLIIYSNAKKAYLFDPNNNKIKDIIPVNIGEVAGAATEATPKITPTEKTTPTPEATTAPTE